VVLEKVVFGGGVFVGTCGALRGNAVRLLAAFCRGKTCQLFQKIILAHLAPRVPIGVASFTPEAWWRSIAPKTPGIVEWMHSNV
jgi:hypothetical protein